MKIITAALTRQDKPSFCKHYHTPLDTDAVNGHGPLFHGVRVCEGGHHGAGATCTLVAGSVGAKEAVVVQEGSQTRGGRHIPDCEEGNKLPLHQSR